MSTRLRLLLLALTLLVIPRSAWAWVETRTIGQEARVEVGRRGSAVVEHAIKFKIAGGPLRSVDVKIADKHVRLADDASIALATEGTFSRVPVPVEVEERPDGTLRFSIDGKRGVGRGLYELRFRYEVDLLQQGAIQRDGPMLRLTWVSPAWNDGIDNAKCTFAIPASPTEPRPATTTPLDDTTSGASSTAITQGAFLTTLTRLAQFDELTLVRPHMAKNETVAWSIRIDPKAIADVGDPRLRLPPALTPVVTEPVQHRALQLALAGFVAVFYAIVLILKHQEVTRAASTLGLRAHPLIPIGVGARAALAGPMLSAGIGMQAWFDDPLPGTLIVLGVVALTCYRVPKAAASVRGPGRWLPLAEADTFARLSIACDRGWLDVSTRKGQLTFMTTMSLFAACVFLIGRSSGYHAHLFALDMVVPLSLFGTGLYRQMPVDRVRSSAAILRQLLDVLRASPNENTIKSRVIGRFPVGAPEPDEIRLSLLPQHSLRGLVGIEAGVAWIDGSGGSVGIHQLLLRVLENSPCQKAIEQRIRNVRWVRGRDSHERVLVLTPSLPMLSTTATLIRRAVKLTLDTASHPASASRTEPCHQALSKKARRSSGISASTSKAGSESLPFQDTW